MVEPRQVLTRSGYAFGLTVATLAARLALEKAAAPEPLTWVIGMTMPLLLVLPLVGGWVGARGGQWRHLVLTLLALGILQRSLLVLIGPAATGLGLGTHLDVRAIEEVALPLGHHDFRGADDPWLAQWFWLLLVPQMMLWVVATVAGGGVLGALPFLWARRARG